jgi:hypothetical protein
MGLSFREAHDDRIDLFASDGAPVATYRFGGELPKPCFHPLYTAAGRQIAGFQMSDHKWHRGLWFTIKYINKTNFWEERPPFGIQQTEVHPQCRFMSPHSVQIGHELLWKSEATGPVIKEHREILFSSLDDGTRQIDWMSSLVVLQDLHLDRTPYTTWGGYSGLTFRASREFHGSSFLLPDGNTTAAITGQPGPWLVSRGQVDGDAEARVCLGMIDHPGNPRSPSPWYGKAGQSYDFFNAAFLFHEPMSVSKGGELRFRYRVLYRDGWWEAGEFDALARSFRDSQP